MKRYMLAFISAIKLVIPIASLLQSFTGGIIEYIENESFYAFVGKRAWLWISIVVIITLAIMIVFFYSLKRKYPGKDLKELLDACGNWIYFFPTDKTLERDSVVEIRKRIGKHGDEPYAIAFIDRIDDNEKSTMLFQHIAIYDRENKKYVCEKPKNRICGKDAKSYYYRPYISKQECEVLLNVRENHGNT